MPERTAGRWEERLRSDISAKENLVRALTRRGPETVPYRRQYGDRLSFMGGMDIQHMLTLGSPAEVAAAVQSSIAIMAPGGGYVMDPDNMIPVPEENYRAYLAACERYARYPVDQPGRGQRE